MRNEGVAWFCIQLILSHAKKGKRLLKEILRDTFSLFEENIYILDYLGSVLNFLFFFCLSAFKCTTTKATENFKAIKKKEITPVQI